MEKEMKKVQFQMQLNSITQSEEDPTIINSTWIVHDFNVNGNNTLLSKDVSLKGAKTLKNKPIVTRYYPVLTPNTNTDALGTHEAIYTINKHGEKAIELKTTPIGTIITEGYIITIKNKDGEDEEVLACDAVLWKSRFPDVCDLLMEWYNRKIPIRSSCEYLYQNYSVIEGVTNIYSPVYYEGHCVLNSEKRGEHEIVNPAYEVSVLTSLNELSDFDKQIISRVLNQKEEDGMAKKEEMFRKVCELSHSDIRSLIYMALKEQMTEEEYDNCYIYDVYDNHVVIETYESNTYKCYDIAYSKENDVVTVDMSTKTEVIRKREWVPVDTVTNLETSLNEAKGKVEKLEKELNEIKTKEDNLTKELNEKSQTLETLTSEKNSLNKKFNEATEKLTSLNSTVENLKQYKEKYNQEQLEKALNEKTEYYETKFRAVNAVEKFNSEEVQNLIKISINENEEGKNAVTSLNSMLVEMVDIQDASKENKPIREVCSTGEKLIQTSTDFDSRYSD